MGRTGLFDLERHFAFYGAYHNNRVNILLHTFFVWPLFFTAAVILHFTPSLYTFPSGFCDHVTLQLNLGFFLTLVYILFYVKLDKKAGSLAAFLCFLCWVGASFLASGLGFSKSWRFVLAAQVFCWGGQFIGHGVFEKRAPALADSFAQALLMGPYFVLLELLQSGFGYEPYPGFHSSVKAKIEDDIKEWMVIKNQKKLS